MNTAEIIAKAVAEAVDETLTIPTHKRKAIEDKLTSWLSTSGHTLSSDALSRFTESIKQLSAELQLRYDKEHGWKIFTLPSSEQTLTWLRFGYVRRGPNGPEGVPHCQDLEELIASAVF